MRWYGSAKGCAVGLAAALWRAMTCAIAALSDSEVSRLAGTLQNQPARGSVVGILLVILIVLGIVFLVQRV